MSERDERDPAVEAEIVAAGGDAKHRRLDVVDAEVVEDAPADLISEAEPPLRNGQDVETDAGQEAGVKAGRVSRLGALAARIEGIQRPTTEGQGASNERVHGWVNRGSARLSSLREGLAARTEGLRQSIGDVRKIGRGLVNIAPALVVGMTGSALEATGRGVVNAGRWADRRADAAHDWANDRIQNTGDRVVARTQRGLELIGKVGERVAEIRATRSSRLETKNRNLVDERREAGTRRAQEAAAALAEGRVTDAGRLVLRSAWESRGVGRFGRRQQRHGGRYQERDATLGKRRGSIGDRGTAAATARSRVEGRNNRSV